MQWFGPGLMPGRYLLATVDSLSASLLFVLTFRLTSSWTWALLAPLWFIGSTPVHHGEFAAFNIPYPSWYNLLLFACSATLLPRLLGAGGSIAFVLAGALAGLGFTFKPNVGLFQLAATSMVCLLGFGRQGAAFDRALWWTWWTGVLGGLLVVFWSAQTSSELAAFLAPIAVAAVLVARDAQRSETPHEGVSLLGRALLIGAGFLAICVPWLVWAWSILGSEWFARRALFLGAGFESFYYIPAPSQLVAVLVALATGVAAWLLPARLRERGVAPARIALGGAAALVLAFAFLVWTRPMPEGLYAAVMRVAEPCFFHAAALVEWSMLLLWLRLPAGDPRTRPLAVATLCGAALYLQIFPRTDLMHWFSSAPLLFPPGAWLLKELAGRWGEGSSLIARRAVGIAIAAPFAALALFRVGYFFDARWDLAGWHLERTPETVLAIEHAPISINAGKADSFRDLEATVDFIRSHSAASDPVFTFPSLDYVSYLSLRKPGNRHGYYFPGWPGHETEAEVLSFLERRPPRLAVTLYEHQAYFSIASMYYFLFDDFFQSRYRTVARRGPYALFAETAASDPILPDATAAAGPSVPSKESAIEDALGPARMSVVQDAMASPDASTRAATVQQMAEWEIRGDFAPLRKALADADPRVRANSVRALAYTRSPAMRDALLDAAAHATVTKDAVLAIRATTASCDTTCVPRLLALARSNDSAVSLAARGTLGELPGMRLQSSYWWQWKDTVARDFDDPVAAELRSALEDPAADGELRILAFAMADLLGLDSCSEPLRRWAAKTPEEAGADFKVCTALEHLSRSSCAGPWMEGALDWFPLDPVLSPRVVLREARKDPAAADPVLARAVDEKRGVPRALVSWICGVTGGRECFAAVQRALLESDDEAERVAAAWAWSQLAPDDAAIAKLQETVARDVSPQVRETARYGLARREKGT